MGILMKKVKEIITLFVPPIFFSIKRRLFHKEHKYPKSLPMRKRLSDRMIIIGNGPSLNKTLDLYMLELQKGECMAVNFFAFSDVFEQIRPSVYLFADPEWFTLETAADKQTCYRLIDTIRDKTIWPMTVVMDAAGNDCYIAKRLSENPLIDLQFYGVSYYKEANWNLFEAWNVNHYTPPGYNVLTLGIWLSLYWNYPNTYFVGADMSFIKDVKVDQQTNMLYTLDQHFYDTKRECNDGLFNEEGYRRYYKKTMGSFYSEMTNVYDELNLLKSFADWKDLKIYNASEYSLIDCFERKKLK